MDRSPTTVPTTDHQPTTWPEHREDPGSPTSLGPQFASGRAVRKSGRPASRFGQAVRRLIPSSGPAIGREPAYSTGGGFRSGNRPEPPVRNGPSLPNRGGGPPAGGGTGGGGTGGPRMPRRGGDPGPRPERYWTDYLRIALPIIGLILMLSVFIFWVGSIIDGNADDASVTPTGEVALSTTTPPPGGVGVTATVVPAQSAAPSSADNPEPSPSEAASERPATEPTTPPEEDASTAPDEEATDEPAADEEATVPPADEGATFAVDDAVVTARQVNLRSEASNADDTTILRTLDAGAELTVIGEPENDGEFDWYPVSDADGEGFVREDFLEAA